jgi:hypothetical protein
VYSQALVPLDSSFEATSDFEVAVELVGYSGCLDGSADVDGDGVPDTPIDVTDVGLVYESEKVECHCVAEDGYTDATSHIKHAWVNKGSYMCTWSTVNAQIDGAPRVEFVAKPNFPACKKAVDASGPMLNDWGRGENQVYTCPNVTLASAHMVRWWAYASPLWDELPNENIEPFKDQNIVNGTIGLEGIGGAFRGSEMTEVIVALIPSKYTNLISPAGLFPPPSPAPAYGYRLQHSENLLGDVPDFETKADIYNGSLVQPSDFLDSTSDYYELYYGWEEDDLLTNFITDQAYIETENQVHVAIGFSKATLMMYTEIGIQTGASEAAGVIGGLLGVLAGLIILIMVRIETMAHPESPIRQRVSLVHRHSKTGLAHFHRLALGQGRHGGELVRELTEEELADLKTAFDSADDNGDGVLTVKELHSAMKASGIPCTARQTRAVMEAADGNGNGSLDFDEFCQVFQREHPDARDQRGEDRDDEDNHVPKEAPLPEEAKGEPVNDAIIQPGQDGADTLVF